MKDETVKYWESVVKKNKSYYKESSRLKSDIDSRVGNIEKYFSEDEKWLMLSIISEFITVLAWIEDSEGRTRKFKGFIEAYKIMREPMGYPVL